MRSRPANDGLPWTRPQLILAFELYCRVPFKQTTTRNPFLRDLAGMIGRTPASIARKLGNFGAFDPVLAASNVTGLGHGSKLDRAIWDEFHQDWSTLVSEAHAIRESFAPGAETKPVFEPPTGPSERVATTKQRLHQAFFRDAVLSSYNAKCCITDLPLVPCLVAGHIIPWSVDATRRADPTNGLCLSATFDRLFDAGLITINSSLTLAVSGLVRFLDDRAVADMVSSRHGQPISLPARFSPDPRCLQWHRENIYRDR